jgi:hydrogenase maturation protease
VKTALVGFGNSCHGDDGIGPAAARRIYQSLLGVENLDLLELATSDFGVMEALIGYERAVIIDALVDEEAEVGTVRRLELPEAVEDGHLSPHTAGFGAALALARKLGLAVPDQLALYGVVIREPPCFSERLSPELEARLDDIARAVAAAEFTDQPRPPEGAG